MNKIIRLVIVVIIIMSLVTFTGCNNKDDFYLNEDGEFKILTLADLHFMNNDSIEDQEMLDRMDRLVEHTSPDLIVLLGDMTYTLNNDEVLRVLVEKIDTYKIPWAPVYGNHDPESSNSRGSAQVAINNKRAMNDVLAESEYCIFESGPEDIDGEGNYYVNIRDNDKNIIQTLFFIDSGDYIREELADRYDFVEGYTFFDYEFIHPSQIEWYESVILDISKKQNKGEEVVPSLAFFHIPLPEYETAWNLYMEGSDEVIYHGGAKDEGNASSPFNTGMFDKMVDLGSTKAVFVGHNHANDFCVEYKGIQLNYSGGMRHIALYPGGRANVENKLGGRLITVKEDSTFSNEKIYDSDLME